MTLTAHELQRYWSDHLRLRHGNDEGVWAFVRNDKVWFVRFLSLIMVPPGPNLVEAYGKLWNLSANIWSGIYRGERVKCGTEVETHSSGYATLVP